MSSEVTDSMATTHFEVIGVIGIDAVGVRHYRRSELEANLDQLESRIRSPECHDLISIVKFNIETGKKHQIRAQASQLLHCPIVLDTKYGYDPDKFSSPQFKNLLAQFPETFYE